MKTTDAYCIRILNDINRIDNMAKSEVKSGFRTLLVVFATLAVIILIPVLSMFLFNLSSGADMRMFAIIYVTILLAVGVIWRSTRLRRFMKVKKAHEKVKIEPVDSVEKIRELHGNSAAVFVGEFDEKFFDFFYNWLVHRKALKQETVRFWTFTGEKLRGAFPGVQVLDYEQYYVLDLREIYIKSEYCREFSFFGGRWFDDLVK